METQFDREMKRALNIHAKIQAKVWRNQMKGKHKDTVLKELLKKINKKYPELDRSDAEFVALGVI